MAASQTPPSTANIDRSTALFERPPMGIADPAVFDAVKQAIAARFAPAGVEGFLQSLERSHLRVRNFEAVLEANKLGAGAPVQYARLTSGDRGQIREFYLASLERVEIALRDKYFRLYAYY